MSVGGNCKGGVDSGHARDPKKFEVAFPPEGPSYNDILSRSADTVRRLLLQGARGLIMRKAVSLDCVTCARRD